MTMHLKSAIASGAKGIIQRIIPNKAIFNIKPDNNIVPAIGATVYVVGCHVWNGNNGILIANAKKNPPMIQKAVLGTN